MWNIFLDCGLCFLVSSAVKTTSCFGSVFHLGNSPLFSLSHLVLGYRLLKIPKIPGFRTWRMFWKETAGLHYANTLLSVCRFPTAHVVVCAKSNGSDFHNVWGNGFYFRIKYFVSLNINTNMTILLEVFNTHFNNFSSFTHISNHTSYLYGSLCHIFSCRISYNRKNWKERKKKIKKNKKVEGIWYSMPARIRLVNIVYWADFDHTPPPPHTHTVHVWQTERH